MGMKIKIKTSTSSVSTYISLMHSVIVAFFRRKRSSKICLRIIKIIGTTTKVKIVFEQTAGNGQL